MVIEELLGYELRRVREIQIRESEKAWRWRMDDARRSAAGRRVRSTLGRGLIRTGSLVAGIDTAECLEKLKQPAPRHT